MDKKLQDLITELTLPDEFSNYIAQFFDPIAKIIHKLTQQNFTPVIGINGSQGSGKSTAAAILKIILESRYKHRVAVLSIDDFYHTKAKRIELSQSLHPLFITRGVPGTHDVNLTLKIVNHLKKVVKGEQVLIPHFDKAKDDRKPENQWEKFKGPVSVIIFEGWCISSPPIEDTNLLNPINDLERKEDNHAVWRKTSNQFLKREYQKLFSQIDWLLMLKAPNFDIVFEWRLLQEQKLRKITKGTHSQLLNKSQLVRFVRHYQRLT